MNATNKLKLFLALVAVFALTVTITFGARRVLSKPLDAMPSDADLKSAREDVKAKLPRLPKDTEEKLAAALYPEAAAPATIIDPFVDRTGVTTSPSPVKVSATGPGLPITLQPELPDRNARLSQWQQSVRAAVAENISAPPPMTTAYLITELSPTGQIEITGRHGVFLYLDSEKRTITADVGAKFYDGVLTGITSEGVQFRTTAGRNKLVPWSKRQDLSNSGAPGLSPTFDVGSSPKQPSVNPAKPISRNTPATEQTDRYADLQEAVKDRYPQYASASQSPAPLPSPAASNAKPDCKGATNSPPCDSLEASTAKSSGESSSRLANFNHVLGVRPESEATPSPSPSPSPTPIATPSPAAPEVGAATKPPAPSTTPVVPVPKVMASKPAEPRKQVCDLAYHGDRISILNESDRPLSLLALVNQLNKSYGANIVLDYDIQETPIRITVNDTPWTTVLHSILDLNDLDMVCLDGGIAQIAKRTKIAQISDQRRRSAPIVREVFKLRYLQPTSGGRTNLAGQTQSSNGANIQSLEDAIRDILKAGGDTRGEARRVPGHNELLVAATQQQMDEIRELIARVDRPGYQVKINAVVYTANENWLRDIGSQLSIAAFNVSNTNIGGISTLPNVSNTTGGGSGTGTGSGTGSNTGQGVAGSNPGGIPGLLAGMRQPSNGLGASNPLVTLGGGMVFPSAQFALQITAAQQSGKVNIKSQPFGIVADGETFDLQAGIQIPVVTTTIAGGAPFQSGQVQFIEGSRITQINPQVAEDEQGKPAYVTLNLRLENNSVDTSLGTFNGIPGVNRQSLQTILRLRNGETAVIGGIAADQVSDSKSKVPGVGDLPIIGNMFKRKQKQTNSDRLYFAITVEVIPQDAAIPNFDVPVDATTPSLLSAPPKTSQVQPRKP